MNPTWKFVALFAAAFAGGLINAISGGGTLLTFPSLLSVGVAPITANGTSTVALLSGSFSALHGYRKDVALERSLLWSIALPSTLGGFLGAYVVSHVSDAFFRSLVPWLILGATLIFMAQDPVRRWATRVRVEVGAPVAPRRPRVALLVTLQFLIAIYGGFFGAGMGILMLALFGVLGFTNIHQMNGLKNLAAICTNAVATLTFALAGRVLWGLALGMALAATLGGFVGSRVAKRVGQTWVRRLVSATGLAIGAYFLLRR